MEGGQLGYLTWWIQKQYIHCIGAHHKLKEQNQHYYQFLELPTNTHTGTIPSKLNQTTTTTGNPQMHSAAGRGRIPSPWYATIRLRFTFWIIYALFRSVIMTIGQWGANYEWFEPSSNCTQACISANHSAINCIILLSMHPNQATMQHRTAILEFTKIPAQRCWSEIPCKSSCKISCETSWVWESSWESLCSAVGSIAGWYADPFINPLTSCEPFLF